jgi:hypothetical protein
MSQSPFKLFDRLVGTWTTEMTHPALPNAVVHGHVVTEWLEGERFLIQRSRTDHADFPDAISIIGSTDDDRVDPSTGMPVVRGEPRLTMHYFDSRGVFRVYDTSIDTEAWRFSRLAPGFSQRFTGTFAPDGDSIEGLSQLSDDASWKDDLRTTYRRSVR